MLSLLLLLLLLLLGLVLLHLLLSLLLQEVERLSAAGVGKRREHRWLSGGG